MALLARIGSNNLKAGIVGKYSLKQIQSGSFLGVGHALKSTGSAQQQVDAFFEKNKSLGRPVSPHMTIYKFKLPPLLSGTHRATGVALCGELAALGIIGNFVYTDFTQFLTLMQSLQTTMIGSLFVYDLKFCLVFPLLYHSFNGLRHLVWDAGYGFKLSETYASGWAVLGLSLLLTFIILGNPLYVRKEQA